MNIGTDKFAHTGISAMLVAMLSVILVIQDAAPSWDYLLFSFIVAVVVLSLIHI